MKRAFLKIIIVCLIAYFGLFTLTSCSVIQSLFPNGEENQSGNNASAINIVVTANDTASATVTAGGMPSTDTYTPTASSAAVPSASGTSQSASASATVMPSASASGTSQSASASATVTPSASASGTSQSASQSASASASASAMSSASASATVTPSASSTVTPSPSQTVAPSPSSSPSSSPSASSTVLGNVAFTYLGDNYGEHITTAEQFAKFFQYAALYKIDEMELYLDFLGANPSNEQFSAAVNTAMETISIAHGFNLGATCLNGSQSKFRITFTNWVDYDPNTSTKTLNPDEYYTPIDNLIAVRSKALNQRANDFNAFKIELLSKSAPVTTSEQLLFVITNGVKPVPAADSIAETIYNRAKAVLREIVDDSMTDVEKVIAISDWLSKNVTYDEYIIQLVAGGGDGTRYNAHFLEGPFIDGRSVCDGFSKAFVLMTRIEGIESIVIEGTAGGGGHAWNKVNLKKDGMPHWYVVDNTWNNASMNADLDPIIVGAENYELWTRAYMLVTDEDIGGTHVEDVGHDYPVATGGNPDVDVYASIVYGEDAGTPLTLKITSDTELDKVLRWAKGRLDAIDSESVKFMMLDLEVTYNYGDNFGSEVNRVNTIGAIGLNITKVRFGSKMGKQYLLFLL